jgi:hypothetical protein
MIARDVKEDAHGGKRDHQARAARGHEGKRNPGQRDKPEHGSEVDQRLAAHERRQAGREQLSEGIVASRSDAEARVREQREGTDDRQRAHESQFLADDGEDHVRVRLREVEHLRDALGKTPPEDPAGPDADERLH